MINMKTIKIFALTALALGMVACDDKSDLGIQQTNPQLPEYEVGDLQVSLAPEIANGLDLNNVTSSTIPVIVVNSPVGNLPENATMEFDMDLAATSDFSDVVTLPVTDGAVSFDSWEQACTKFYGIDPSKQNMYIRFAAYVWDGKQQSRIGTWFLNNEIAVTPVDAKLDIENSYTLVIGNKTIEMTHSESHPYVEPNFYAEIELTDTDVPMKWAIRSVSGKSYGVAQGTAPDTLSGDLIAGGADGVINTPGTYTLKVNMLDLNYSFSSVTIVVDFDYLYTPGSSNSWNQSASQRLFTNDRNEFKGFAYLDGEFKFTSASNWDGYNFGAGPEAGQLSTDGSAGNLNVAKAGLYFCDVWMNSLTYSTVMIETIGLVGPATSAEWDASAAEPLTSNDYLIWSGDINLKPGEWKFCCNYGWDVNLGGPADNLDFNGANLVFDGEAGVYTVTLDLSKLPYSCSVIKK